MKNEFVQRVLAILAGAVSVVFCGTVGAEVVVAAADEGESGELVDSVRLAAEGAMGSVCAERECVLFVSARDTGGGVRVVLELRIAGEEPAVLEREVSVASRDAQARAMTREILSGSVRTVEPIPEAVEGDPAEQSRAPAGSEVEFSARPRGPFDRRVALALSLTPTLTLTIVGGALFWTGASDAVSWSATGKNLFAVGLTSMALGVIVCPALGALYSRSYARALGTAGLRLATVAGSLLSLWAFAYNPGQVPLALTVAFAAATAVMAIVEASMAGIVADRANEKFSKKARMYVSATVITSPGGRSLPAVALGGTF